MIHRAFKVISPKGDALFLNHNRAEEYAIKHHGTIVRMFGQGNGTPPDYSNNPGQEGAGVVESDQPVQQEPPIAGEMGTLCG